MGDFIKKIKKFFKDVLAVIEPILVYLNLALLAYIFVCSSIQCSNETAYADYTIIFDDADNLANNTEYGYLNGYLVFKSGDGTSFDTFEFLTNANSYYLNYYNFVIPYNYDVFYRALSQPFYIDDLEASPFSYEITLQNTAIGFVGGSVQMDFYIKFVGSDNVIYSFEWHETAGFSSESPNYSFLDVGRLFYDYVLTELTLPDYNIYVTEFEVLLSRPYGTSIDTRLEYDVITHIECWPTLPYNEYVVTSQSFVDNIGSYSTLAPVSNVIVRFAGDLLNIEFFPNLSLLGLLTIFLCVPLALLVCKFFLGG